MKYDTVRVGSAVLVRKFDDDHERLLLGMKKKGGKKFWVIPGGKIELGETIEQTAVREIREETGYRIALTSRLGTYEMIMKNDHRIIIYSFGRVRGGKLKSGDDLYDARWFTRAQLKKLRLSKFIRGVLKDAGYL